MKTREELLKQVAQFKHEFWALQNEIHAAIRSTQDSQLRKVQRIFDSMGENIRNLPPESQEKGAKWQGKLIGEDYQEYEDNVPNLQSITAKAVNQVLE